MREEARGQLPVVSGTVQSSDLYLWWPHLSGVSPQSQLPASMCFDFFLRVDEWESKERLNFNSCFLMFIETTGRGD